MFIYLQESPSFHSAHSEIPPETTAQSRDVYRRLRDLALRLQGASEQTQHGLADVFKELQDLSCMIDGGDKSLVRDYEARSTNLSL